MPETRKPTAADYKAWAIRCLAEGRGLTDWERSFVIDMVGVLDLRGSISEKQAEILERIWVQKVP